MGSRQSLTLSSRCALSTARARYRNEAFFGILGLQAITLLVYANPSLRPHFSYFRKQLKSLAIPDQQTDGTRQALGLFPQRVS